MCRDDLAIFLSIYIVHLFAVYDGSYDEINCIFLQI